MRKDYKNACQQLISTIALLLSKKSPNAIFYIYVILNFVCMTDYIFYTDETL